MQCIEHIGGIKGPTTHFLLWCYNGEYSKPCKNGGWSKIYCMTKAQEDFKFSQQHRLLTIVVGEGVVLSLAVVGKGLCSACTVKESLLH